MNNFAESYMDYIRCIESSLRDMEQEIMLLDETLKTATSRLNEAEVIREKWKQHVNDEPWWLILLAFFGAEAPRINRDSVFCSGMEIIWGQFVGGDWRSIND